MQPPQTWEATVEEFVALQSILQRFQAWLDDTELQLSPEEADELLQQGPQGRQLSCEASVHVAMPEDGLPVQVRGGLSENSQDSISSSASAAVATVRHLPPIQLHLDIPPGYPEEAPPDVQLACEWLSHSQIAALQEQLDLLWDEQGPGLPVGFVWADWLQNEALQFLGLQDGLVLPGGEAAIESDGSQAPRQSSSAISLSPSAPGFAPGSPRTHKQNGQSEEVAGKGTSNAHGQESEPAGKPNSGAFSTPDPASCRPSTAEASGASQTGGMDGVAALVARLVSFNAMREVEIFKEGSHACGICFEETLGLRHVWASRCAHAFCQDCIGQMCSVHIAEGSLDSLCCPIPDCKAPFVRQNVRGLLSGELTQRWEDLELKQALERMTDVLYCPRCSAACVEDSDNCVQCPKCFYAFCGLCCDSWHPGMTCMSAEMKLKVLQERMAGRKDTASDLKRREAEFLSLVHISQTAKICPNCGMAIEKAEGCNKMTCTNCLRHFCYKCNSPVLDYGHFRDGGCRLFDNSEVQRWQQEWDMQVQRAQAQARNQIWVNVNPGARMVACPQCGQRNAKVLNNNLLRCWACSAHYCYLCRQLLRGTKERGTGAGSHFGRGKCKQHSA